MDKYNLVIISDQTGSMSEYLAQIKQQLSEIIHMSSILNQSIIDIGILLYADYDVNDDVLQWSGWLKKDKANLDVFVNKMHTRGGGGPEALKTALRHYDFCLRDPNLKTIMILYGDQAPHNYLEKQYEHYNYGYFKYSLHQEYDIEKESLGLMFDWVTLVKSLKNNYIIYPIINTSNSQISIFYVYLTLMTCGNVICLSNTRLPNIIYTTTVNLLLMAGGEESTIPDQVYEITSGQLKQLVQEGKIQQENDLKVSDISFSKLQVLDSSLQKINLGVGDQLKRFEEDELYRNFIYSVFEDMLNRGNGYQIQQNPLFGKFWRKLGSNKTDQRHKNLTDKMSQQVAKLDQKEKLEMKQYIAQTYDESDRIQQLVDACSQKLPAIILQSPIKVTQDEFLELNRSCNKSILSKVIQLTKNLTIIDDKKEIQNQHTIPLEIHKKGQLFNILPSLISKGIVFANRSACLLALICVYTNSVIKQQAEQFLKQNYSKWIDRAMGENYTFEFVKLITKFPQYLTKQENQDYLKYKNYMTLRINGYSEISIWISYQSYKTSRLDYKSFCSQCRQNISNTLMLQGGICGSCFSTNLSNEPRYPNKKNQQVHYQFPQLDENRSYMCECKDCKVHYAVIDVDSLIGKAKCHYCREGIKDVPYLTCTQCKNKFLNPSETICNEYQCAECYNKVENGRMTVKIQQYINENGAQFVGYKMQCKDIFSTQSLYTVKDFIIECPKKDPNFFKFHNKIVLNADDVKQEIFKRIDSGEADTDTCVICFDDIFKTKIVKQCGNTKCQGSVCQACTKLQFSNIRPGQIIQRSNLQCSYCRQLASVKIMRRFDKDVAVINDDIKSMNNQFYYAICISCFKPKEYCEKVCSQGVPVVNAFECNDCAAKIPGNMTVKQCPNAKCGIKIEKRSGCDHICCTQCNTHFCWQCLYIPKQGENIYSHTYTHQYDDEDDDMEYM